MPQTKIVFFDIDGTLIDMQTKQITPKTVEALHRLQDSGVKLCIATGRSPMVLPKIAEIQLDAYLTFNGSLCYDKQGVIFSNPIPHSDVLHFIRNAAALGRPVCVSTKARLAANGTDADLADYFAIANEPVNIAEDFDAVCHEDIYQLMLGCREKDYPALLDGFPGAKIAAWWDRAVDVIPASGGKGIGIEKLLADCGIDSADAQAIGHVTNARPNQQTGGTATAVLFFRSIYPPRCAGSQAGHQLEVFAGIYSSKRSNRSSSSF